MGIEIPGVPDAFESSKFTKTPNAPHPSDLMRIERLYKNLDLAPNEYGYFDSREDNKRRKLERELCVLWIEAACGNYDLEKPKWLAGIRLGAMDDLSNLAFYAAARLPRKERHLRDLYSKLKWENYKHPESGQYSSKLYKCGELLNLYRNQYFAIRDLFASQAHSKHTVFCLLRLRQVTEEFEKDLEFPKEVYA